MKTKLLMTMVVLGAVTAFAAPPGGKMGGMGGKGEWGNPEQRAERMEARERELHLMFVVALSEALELTDAEALKLGDKLKVVEDKRRPLRMAMFEAMRGLKAAADGDAAALPQVDANVQKVLDGRAQLASLDKELFATLSQGLTPQKRAKLALTLGQLHREAKGFKRGGRR